MRITKVKSVCPCCDGVELQIVKQESGKAIVRLTDPENPVQSYLRIEWEEESSVPDAEGTQSPGGPERSVVIRAGKTGPLETVFLPLALVRELEKIRPNDIGGAVRLMIYEGLRHQKCKR